MRDSLKQPQGGGGITSNVPGKQRIFRKRIGPEGEDIIRDRFTRDRFTRNLFSFTIILLKPAPLKHGFQVRPVKLNA
jgi:hypothetical protein